MRFMLVKLASAIRAGASRKLLCPCAPIGEASGLVAGGRGEGRQRSIRGHGIARARTEASPPRGNMRTKRGVARGTVSNVPSTDVPDDIISLCLSLSRSLTLFVPVRLASGVVYKKPHRAIHVHIRHTASSAPVGRHVGIVSGIKAVVWCVYITCRDLTLTSKALLCDDGARERHTERIHACFLSFVYVV